MLSRLLQMVWCSVAAGVIRASLYGGLTGELYRKPVWWSMLSRISACPLGDPGGRVLCGEVVGGDRRAHLRRDLLHPGHLLVQVLHEVAEIGVFEPGPQLAERPRREP